VANRSALWKQWQYGFAIIRGYFGFKFFNCKFNFCIALILHLYIFCVAGPASKAQSDSFFLDSATKSLGALEKNRTVDIDSKKEK